MEVDIQKSSSVLILSGILVQLLRVKDKLRFSAPHIYMYVHCRFEMHLEVQALENLGLSLLSCS